VPVVKLKYNEVKPISHTVEAKSFLEEYRDNFLLGGLTSETKEKDLSPTFINGSSLSPLTWLERSFVTRVIPFPTVFCVKIC
jgi:hypothetical protein